jgi:polyisoprenoid-binding protein YceI
LGLAWYTGRFTRLAAELNFDAGQIENSQLSFTVDLRSVRTEYQGHDKDWDKELAESPEFMHASQFPTASFTSSRVTAGNNGDLVVTGDLNFRGISRPLSIMGSYNGVLLKDNHGRTLIGFSMHGSLLRSEFGLIFFLGPLMPDEVQLIIETQFVLKTTN